MAQRSTRSARRSKQELTTSNSDLVVRRIDQARHQGSRWVSRFQQLPEKLVGKKSGTLADDPAFDDEVLTAEFLREDKSHQRAQATESCPRAETAFERSVRDVLAVPRWRSQLTDLSQSFVDRTRRGPLTVAVVSLGDELDAARTVFALAMLHADSGREVIVVDGDRHRRTLSILLQHNSAAGLWDAIPVGKPARALSIPLASRGISFVPAGNRTLASRGTHVVRSLNADRGTCTLMLMDAGVWPALDLATYVPAADLIYANLRCGRTRRKQFRDLVDLLKQSGRTLAGSVVSGAVA